MKIFGSVIFTSIASAKFVYHIDVSGHGCNLCKGIDDTAEYQAVNDCLRELTDGGCGWNVTAERVWSLLEVPRRICGRAHSLIQYRQIHDFPKELDPQLILPGGVTPRVEGVNFNINVGSTTVHCAVNAYTAFDSNVQGGDPDCRASLGEVDRFGRVTSAITQPFFLQGNLTRPANYVVFDFQHACILSGLNLRRPTVGTYTVTASLAPTVTTTEEPTTTTTTMKPTTKTTTTTTAERTTSTSIVATTLTPSTEMITTSTKTTCSPGVELMYLQDTSTSMDPWVKKMQAGTKAIFANLTTTYTRFKMGVASFVDKPIPTLGVGTFGGKQGWHEDYCYMLHTPLRSDEPALEQAFDDMWWNMGSGGSWPEAPLEGMAYVVGDVSAGWTNRDENTRVLLVVTDTLSHQPGDVDAAIRLSWELPRTWVNESYSTGGFGSTWYFRGSRTINSARESEYMEMSQLFHKLDTNQITEDESTTLSKYIDAFGPWPWPKLLENPNDGVDPSLCNVAEYIAPKALGALLRAKNIVPLFMLVDNHLRGPEFLAMCQELEMTPDINCLKKYYENILEDMDAGGLVVTMADSGDMSERVITVVNDVAGEPC